jgi:RNA polymerase sigma-70 factor, ECF subfamily
VAVVLEVRGALVRANLAVPDRHQRDAVGARAPLPPSAAVRLGAPSDDPSADATPAAPGVRWLEPLPDALVAPESDDPAAIAAVRAGLRLALIARLQCLSARQRAVLILRDVLSFRAHEVAAMLGTSTAAVKSVLQRARAGLQHVAADELTEPGEPRSLAARAIHRRVRALGHVAARARAAGQRGPRVAGSTTWFAGKRTCVPYIRRVLRTPGDWRMGPTVAVLTVSAAGIGRIPLFGDPGVLARFGADR